jgi:hypothetical protein
MALTAKYTGFFVAGACLVPFLRWRADRRTLRALVLLGLAMALLAVPVYLRNLSLTGSLVPMARNREPMRTIEGSFVLRSRQIQDYLTFNPKCLLRPSIYHVPQQRPYWDTFNQDMTSVWGLTYASIWYDPFAQFVHLRHHRDGVSIGPLLTILGLVPTAAMLLGFLAATLAAARTHCRSPDAPLVVMTLLGAVTFILFTWQAPSMAAVKGSYLLPLTVPAGAFFARGVSFFGHRLRMAILVISLLAAFTAATVFTNGSLVWSEPIQIQPWLMSAKSLQSQSIPQAISFLLQATK